MKKILNIEIITHYAEDDEEFNSDYYSIDLMINGKLAATYGDYYHDKGKEKVEGFFDALNYLGYKMKLTETNVADGQT